MSTSIEMGTKLTMGCRQKVKHPGSEFFLRPPDRGLTIVKIIFYIWKSHDRLRLPPQLPDSHIHILHIQLLVENCNLTQWRWYCCIYFKSVRIAAIANDKWADPCCLATSLVQVALYNMMDMILVGCHLFIRI